MTTDTRQLALATLVISLGLLRLAGGHSRQSKVDTLYFEHVNVIDGLSNTPSFDMTVVVTNGRRCHRALARRAQSGQMSAGATKRRSA